MKISTCLLGIDLGTTNTKTAIIDPDGRLISLATQEYDIQSPRRGWAEQDPETWFQAVIQTIRRALTTTDIRPGQISAIGLSGQMHAPVCLDEHGQPLRPAIIWADQRSSAQVEQVYHQIGRQNLGKWTANPLATGFMLPTWLWLRAHEPETFQRSAHLLLPKDYLRYRLTGEIGTEPSDASATLLFDTVNRRWSDDLLAALSLSPSPLPPIYESTAIAGTLLPKIARATGLLTGTPVVYGGSDQACQALGNGIIAPGVVSCTIGTGGQLFTPTLEPHYDPELRLHLFCHVLPEAWHLEAATLSAGLSLKWLRDQIFEGKSYQVLVDSASLVPPGSEGLTFLPYLAGERTPHMDPGASGAFVGLTLRHTRAHLVRAALEGVVLSLRQGLEIMLGLGVPIKKMVASGGAVNHPLWLQLQADIFNRPIHRTQTRQAAALGAALLAGVGVQVYNTPREACQRTVRWSDETIQPDPANSAVYVRKYQTFIQLYPSLKSVLH